MINHRQSPSLSSSSSFPYPTEHIAAWFGSTVQPPHSLRLSSRKLRFEEINSSCPWQEIFTLLFTSFVYIIYIIFTWNIIWNSQVTNSDLKRSTPPVFDMKYLGFCLCSHLDYKLIDWLRSSPPVPDMKYFLSSSLFIHFLCICIYGNRI